MKREDLTPASITDTSTIRQIMQEAADFKRSRGDNLWGEEPFTDQEVAEMIQDGKMFIYRADGVTVASVMLAENDERIWGAHEGNDESAFYIHRLCVGDMARGTGTAAKVIDLAARLAIEYGKSKLRLDCPYDNLRLHKRYEELGFHEVGRYDRPKSLGGRNPGQNVYKAALFEKATVLK